MKKIPELPYSFLVNIGAGPLPRNLQPNPNEVENLWGFDIYEGKCWEKYALGGSSRKQYAADTRSEYAKRHFPNLVDKHNQRATEENLKINEESTQEPSFQKEKKTELPPEYWTALSDAIQHGQKIYERWHNQDIKEQVDRMIACFEQALKE